MKHTSRADGSFRRSSISTRGPLALACAAAVAMGAPAVQAQQDQLEEIITTGTRIQRDGTNTPTPVTVVSSEQMSLMAPGNMIEALSQLPLFYGNTSSSSPGGFFTTPGSGNLNLRGIGTNRTLVLLDGKRVVSSSRFGGTDINLFPEDLIRSVETVTGGASAAYGTDAVTGVTNFILDTDFEGVRGRAQTGQTSRGDGENHEIGFTFGSDVGEKFHVILSADKFEQDGIFTYEDRDWYKAWGLVNNPDANGPAQLVRPYVVSTTATFDGLISAPGTPLHRLNFNSEGTAATPFLFNPNQLNASNAPVGQSQSIAGGAYSGDFIGADRPNVQPEYERSNMFFRLDYDVTDNVNVYWQSMYGTSWTKRTGNAGQFQFVFSPMIIYSGNAFLPPAIQQIMDDNAIDSFTLNRMGHSTDLALGGEENITDTRMSQNTIGFEAELDGGGAFDGWRLQGYYQDGENKTRAIQASGIRLDRIHMAHDAVVDPATGAIVCNVTLVSGLYPDCVPLNPFGRGNMSQSAIDWVTGTEPGQFIDTPLYYTGTGFDLGLRAQYISDEDKVVYPIIEQEVLDFSMDGEIFDDRRAGPISVAFGAGWREDFMNQIVYSAAEPDGNMDTGRPVPANDAALGIRGNSGGDINNTVAIQYSKVPNIRGKMDVTEYFGEAIVPWLLDNKLDMNVAARHADYFGSGGIWAWKFGLVSQLTDSFRLRVTRSHDVRAGTLADRYDQTGGAATVDDPFTGQTGVPIFQAGGGDPNILPEESDTLSLGFVYQPGWADGLSLTMDWYEVDLSEAIQALTSQQVIDQCFAGDQQLCARIFRLPDNTINLVQARVRNVAKAFVSGVDFELGYNRSVDWFGGGETIGVRFISSHLIKNSTQAFMSPEIDRAGQLNIFEFPKDKYILSANYSNGRFAGYIQARRVDDGLRDVLATPLSVDDNTIDSVTYIDLNLSYTLEVGDGTWRFFGSAQNLTDKDPPIVANFGLFGATATQTNAGLHDLLGRRYTFGAEFRF